MPVNSESAGRSGGAITGCDKMGASLNSVGGVVGISGSGVAALAPSATEEGGGGVSSSLKSSPLPGSFGLVLSPLDIQESREPPWPAREV